MEVQDIQRNRMKRILSCLLCAVNITEEQAQNNHNRIPVCQENVDIKGYQIICKNIWSKTF